MRKLPSVRSAVLWRKPSSFRRSWVFSGFEFAGTVRRAVTASPFSRVLSYTWFISSPLSNC